MAQAVRDLLADRLRSLQRHHVGSLRRYTGPAMVRRAQFALSSAVVHNARVDRTSPSIKQRPCLRGRRRRRQPERCRRFPYNRRDAPPAPRPDPICRAQVRARRVPHRARAVPRRQAGCAGAHVLARYIGASRREASARVAGPRADLRQVRADAVDAARPAPPRHRRRAREAPGQRAAVSVRAGAWRRSLASTAGPSKRYSDRSTATPVASASVAQVHFAELPDGTPVAVKVLRPDIASVIDEGHRADARPARG